ncbi:MAG: DEAD/DEAH box helicase, partial [Thermoanaerobaculia bacterium]
MPPDGAAADPEAILGRFVEWVADLGLALYPAQEEALLELFAGRHVVLNTPTGSGKSLVALGLHFKALCEGRTSFYTSPIKALASEKFFALCDDFGAANVGMLTGDAAINPRAPVLCCTAEVLSNMALRRGESLAAPYVVMDEFHYYSDAERGVAWQVPLLTLPQTQFLLMSATLGDTGAIAEHLRKRTGREVAHVASEHRPVPLDFTYRETPLHETVEELLAAGKAPIYIVSFT